MKAWLCLALIASLAIACGPPDEDVKGNNGVIVINNGATNNVATNNGGATANNRATNNVSDTNNTPEPGSSAANVKAGLTAPSAAHELGEGLLALGSAAVFEASIQANGGVALVTTGTLTQSGESFTYSASPNDRLRVVWSDGPPTDFWVTAFDGDFS